MWLDVVSKFFFHRLFTDRVTSRGSGGPGWPNPTREICNPTREICKLPDPTRLDPPDFETQSRVGS